jgi:hypothetical protein
VMTSRSTSQKALMLLCEDRPPTTLRDHPSKAQARPATLGQKLHSRPSSPTEPSPNPFVKPPSISIQQTFRDDPKRSELVL